jgi:tetratricopeptide (TPR) repeat protein
MQVNRISTQAKIIVGMLCVCAFVLTTQAQPAATPEAKKNRKQAYLRYIEVQRMKSVRTTKPIDLISAYKEIIQLDPTAADPHADLGEVYFFNLNDFDSAEREGQEAVKLDRDCLNGQKLLARLYAINVRFDNNRRTAQIDRAIRAYEEVARLDPVSAEAWAFQSDLAQMKGDQAKQLKALEKLSSISAPSPMDAYFYRQVMGTELAPDQTFFQLSQLYLNQGKNAQAIEAAKRAFELDSDSTVNARSLINILRLSANSDEELSTYVRLIKRTGSPLLQVGYGASLLRVGRYSEAITKLREYLKADPTNADAIYYLAAAQRRSGQRTEAVETLKQAITTVDFSARQRLSIEVGETYEELGRTADAVAYYEGVLNDLANKPKLDAKSSEVFIDLVAKLTRAYNRQGEKKKSQALLSRAKQILGETSPAADLLMVENLREEGQYREALEAVRMAQGKSANNNNKALKLNEALILIELKNYSEGLSLLQGMLTGKGAEDADILTVISNVQMQTGQLKEAEATIRKAVAANPGDSDLSVQLGSILDRSGQKEEAEKVMRAVILREPDNAAALNNLGYFLAERSAQYKEALPLIEKAVSIEPMNGSFLDSLGWVQYKLGKLQEARGQLEKAATMTRRNPAVYEHLGDVLRDLGRLQEARKNWESALEFSVEAGVVARLKTKIKNTQ